MAEPTLSIGYEQVTRQVADLWGLGEVYGTGTVSASASTTVTVSGGTWPTWVASGHILQVGTAYYTVSSRTSDSAIVLTTSVTLSSAAYCIFQADESNWKTIRDMIGNGYRRFLKPPPLPRNDNPNTPPSPPWAWSFLNPVASLSLTNGDWDYDLPDDCGQVTTNWTYSLGTVEKPIQLVDEKTIRANQSQGNASDAPLMVAIRPKAFSSSTGQRFEAIFYPTPDASYTVRYNYSIEPDDLTPTNKYPVGGSVHSGLFLAACQAEAELRYNQQAGPFAQEFMSKLMASVEHDKSVKQSQTLTYTYAAPAIGTYEWLQQEVGLVALQNANRLTWTDAETRLVDSFIQRGLKTFYNQALSPQTKQKHRWSFLRSEYTITTVAPYSTGTVACTAGVVTLTSGTWPSWVASGVLIVNWTWYTIASRDSATQITLTDTSVSITSGSTYKVVQVDYDLPTNFGGLDGPLIFKPGNLAFHTSVPLVGEYQIPEGRQRWDIVSFPQIAALKQKAQDSTYGSRWAITFYPSPDRAYQLVGRVKYDPAPLTAGKYPMCGSSHYETALLACLSLVKPNEYVSPYQMALAASITMDQSEMAPENIGTNSDRSDNYRNGEWRQSWRLTDVTFNGVTM